MSTVELADKVLMQFDDYELAKSEELLIKVGLNEQEVMEGNFARLEHEVFVMLNVHMNYVMLFNEEMSADLYVLTDKGRSAKHAGGHFMYQKLLAEKKVADNDRQMLNDEKLKYDVRNAKRIFSTYWFTFGASLLALALSIANFFRSSH